MPDYRLITARIVASYTDITGVQPRPTPFEIADALTIEVEKAVEFGAACGAVASQTFAGATGKIAHEEAVRALETALNARILQKAIKPISLPLDQLAYKPGGLGTHEGLLWMKVTRGGAVGEWSHDVAVRGMPIQCVVCVLVQIGPAEWINSFVARTKGVQA